MTVSVLPASTASSIRYPDCSSRDVSHVESDVEYRCGVREGADRDEVDARVRVRGDRFEADAARALEQRTPLVAAHLDARHHVVDAHVVEEDEVGAGGHRLF